MIRQSARSYSSSLKTAVVFLTIVCFIILVALAIHIFITVQKSVFDGRHEFVLQMDSDDHQSVLVIFLPATRVVGILPLQMTQDQNVAEDLHTGIDGTVHTLFPFHNDYNIQTALLQAMFRSQTAGSTVTWYDLIRLYLLAKTGATVVDPVDHLPKDTVSTTMFFNLFLDPDIQKDNQTVQIINSTDQAGLGSRLETELTNMGCNVIDVRSAPTEVPVSQINYDTMSYTVSRLQRVLHVSAKPQTQQGIADIQIIIGKDDENPKTF